MKKFQRIVCIIGAVILVAIYVLTLVSAIFYNDGFKQIFTAALYSTVIVPALMYAMILMYRILNKNKQ